MKIAVLTSGRFHLCDLARELEVRGHDVAFHSCVPSFRTRRFGLPDRCNKTMFWQLAPLLMFMRRAQNSPFRALGEDTLNQAVDWLGSRRVEYCDTLIGLSGLSVRTVRTVRKKYGSDVWIERGSRHILSQKQILETLPGNKKISIAQRIVDRELLSYELADKIVVPSMHVAQSFIDYGVPAQKLFRNPYGVDLDMFPPTKMPNKIPPTVIFVGTWSLRKGCDVLWQACQSSGSWHLLHVGPIGDAPVPSSSKFRHVDAVPQWRLHEYFAQAHVFALASREEGLSLVQVQALACGLPVVCTDRTGGEDLREQLLDKRFIEVVPHDDSVRLEEGISRALRLTDELGCDRDIMGAARENISWQAYGIRYSAALERRMFSKVH
jgi:starch synthase